jgi:hypothetical protein
MKSAVLAGLSCEGLVNQCFQAANGGPFTVYTFPGYLYTYVYVMLSQGEC